VAQIHNLQHFGIPDFALREEAHRSGAGSTREKITERNSVGPNGEMRELWNVRDAK
jgi:hypothetical protein